MLTTIITAVKAETLNDHMSEFYPPHLTGLPTNVRKHTYIQTND
jgi:hypothetical protein